MKGRNTGERINGATYRKIVQLAIQGEAVNQIALQTNVVWRTAKAIVERESRPIAERKRELADACMRIAQHATQRIEDDLDKAPFQSLPTIVGIMTDKVVALTSDPAIQPNLHIHLNAVDLIGSFNSMLAKLTAPPKASQYPQSNSQEPCSLASDVPIHSTDARGAPPKSVQEQHNTTDNIQHSLCNASSLTHKDVQKSLPYKASNPVVEPKE